MSMPNQPPLLRDLIVIPELMNDSDLVLELTSGVSQDHAAETLREYVITDSLLGNFGEALNLVKGAVAGQASKATYLHGSFGAGKSHFMAVLHALLSGEPAARGRAEFAPLLADHGWMDGKKFLLVPFHMLGAKSLEQRVFGRYVDYVRELHPDAPIPAVHRTDALLDQMRALRAELGDEGFAAPLPGGAEGEEDEWGESASAWTTQSLDAAFAEAYSDPLRRKLVNDLLVTEGRGKGFFTNTREDAEAFVSLDAGLKEISRHAKSLGYDALILFLDELVLWLINSAGDPQFVAREMQKVTNFVESGDPDRPAPVISFIARQRDLREVVGEEAVSQNELSLLDTLDLASARFSTIALEDRNLPEIAQQRVLRRQEPVAQSDAAIARAFEATARSGNVLDTLLGSGTTGSDLDAFRKTYPFSPAFLDTLVALSQALQRSRTALKLMRRLLIQRRDELRLGQLIPLGDLFDVISEGGDEPFTQKLKVEFTTAQKLYAVRLRPYLLEKYGLAEEDVTRVRRGGAVDGQAAQRVQTFTGDDRLVKTLLMSALVPTVDALKNLTASRLSALNHGSVIDPFGDVISQVSRKVEEWAGRFTEIKYDKGDDPGVGLQLVGVDVDAILSNARFSNTEGARKAAIRKLLYEELGVTETGQYAGDRFDLVWKGSRRSVEVVYGNIRDENEVAEDAFHPADPTAWRVMLDYPFDSDDHTPADDRNRIQRLVERGVRDRTLCWIPASLSAERMRDLSQLVIIDYVLTGHRFDEHAGHLNPIDRERARETLTSQVNTLRDTLKKVLRQTYGLINKQPGDVLGGFDDHLLSLAEGFRPTLPVGAQLAEALASLADQMLTLQYPGHPNLDQEQSGTAVKLAEVKTVLEYVRKATETPDGRVEVDKPHRATMRRVANPLGLGEMHEAAFLLGSQWRQHFNQEAARDAVSGDLRVAKLLEWIDRPQPRGLDRLITNLVIACFAEQTDRAWVEHGGVLDTAPELNKIRDDAALREQRLPIDQSWQTARLRAQEIFGHNPPVARRTRLARMFARTLSDDSRRYRGPADDLVALLEQHVGTLQLDPNVDQGRLGTARRAADLLAGLSSQHDRLEIIGELAAADLGMTATPQRIGKAIKSAAEVSGALRSADWNSLRAIAELPEPYATEARRIFAQLGEAAVADELTVPLAPALKRAGDAAAQLVMQAVRTPIPPAPTPPSPPDKPAPTGSAAVERSAQSGSAGQTLPTDTGVQHVPAGDLVQFAQQLAAERPGATFEITWRVVG